MIAPLYGTFRTREFSMLDFILTLLSLISGSAFDDIQKPRPRPIPPPNSPIPNK
jgi:hypothetical protein